MSLLPTAPAAEDSGVHRDLEYLLGERAWRRLPAAVRARFGEPVRPVDYRGSFDIVRASRLGQILAFCCRLLGTPIAPYTGRNIPALVRVAPTREGVAWAREYRWPRRARCVISSTKLIDQDGVLIEKLPAGLCMPLDVFERDGALHFVSRGYYFELRVLGQGMRLTLPAWLSPGTTHVEHRDQGRGWFRFTMTVTHPLLGELFFQTGRFHAAGG